MNKPVQNWELRKAGDREVRFVTGEQLATLIQDGSVGSDHEVRLQGSSEWLTIAQAMPFIASQVSDSKPTATVPLPMPFAAARPPVRGRHATPARPRPRSERPGSESKRRWTTEEDSVDTPTSATADANASADLPTLPTEKQRRRPLWTGTEDDELDMTPMIDMTFLLLIFFMVTSTISPFAELQLPEAKAGDAEKPEGRVVLVLDYDASRTPAETPRYSGSEFVELKDCRLFLGNDSENAISPDQLQEHLVEAFAENGGGEFILQSNRKMPVGVVREVIKIAKASGAGKTMIGVTRPR